MTSRLPSSSVLMETGPGGSHLVGLGDHPPLPLGHRVVLVAVGLVPFVDVEVGVHFVLAVRLVPFVLIVPRFLPRSFRLILPGDAFGLQCPSSARRPGMMGYGSPESPRGGKGYRALAGFQTPEPILLGNAFGLQCPSPIHRPGMQRRRMFPRWERLQSFLPESPSSPTLRPNGEDGSGSTGTARGRPVGDAGPGRTLSPALFFIPANPRSCVLAHAPSFIPANPSQAPPPPS